MKIEQANYWKKLAELKEKELIELSTKLLNKKPKPQWNYNPSPLSKIYTPSDIKTPKP